MYRVAGIFFLCAAVVLAGCRMDTDAHTVGESGGVRSKTPAMGATQYSGTYKLYKVPAGAKNALDMASAPVFSTHLDKNQQLGFKIGKQGKAEAVAGDQSVPLENGRYEWVMQADPGQYDPVRTTLLVVAIVVVSAVVIGTLIAIEVNAVNHSIDHSLSGLGSGLGYAL